VTPVAIGPEGIVLLTTGSQAADLSVGSMTEPPPKRRGSSTWALWQRLAEERSGFGKQGTAGQSGRHLPD
jgi:oleate hydratase